MGSTYLEDIPAVAAEFNYDLVAKALEPLLSRKSTGATVVGIHGPWGTGKTTLMRAIERELHQKFGDKEAIFIDFNAWKYQERQALWRALILRVLGALRTQGADKARLEELESSLYRSFAVEEKGPWQLNWRTLIVELIGIVLSVLKLDIVAKALKGSMGFFGRLLWGANQNGGADAPVVDEAKVEKLASVLERTTVQRQVVQVQSIEQFIERFDKLINPEQGPRRRVFVFIDDLDRCLPESALEIFEAIKLFLDAPGCGYVVALDRDVIRKGLAVKYSQQARDFGGGLFIDPDEYIEKTISVSYDLPQLSQNDALALIRAFDLPLKLDKTHEKLIITGLGQNPRRVKRFMNTLSVQLNLAKLVKGSGSPIEEALISFDATPAPRRFDYFLKLALISYKYSGVISLALKHPGVLRRLQLLSNDYDKNKEENAAEARTVRNLALDSEPALLFGLKAEEEFWQLMAAEPILTNDLELTAMFLGWFRQSGAAE